MQWTSQCLPLNALHYCLSLNAQKTLKPQSDDIWEMEKNKNEWMTEYMHIAARLLYTCVCKIFQAPELQNINCMRQQQVTFMLIPLLWKWKRTKYHIQNYVKKKKKKHNWRKIVSSLLFVSIVPATKIRVYYLILKHSFRNKSKKTSFLYRYVQVQEYRCDADWIEITLSPCHHCLYFNLSLVIPHWNVMNIFREVPEIQGLIVKMSSDSGFNAE